MMELHEIEELIKNVNRNAIKALLRNAAIMKDPAATPEMKAQAEANVKAISYNKPLPKEPKAPRKQKAAAAEQATQLVTTPPAQTPAAAAPPQLSAVPSPKMDFHEEFAQHHGVDPVKFKATWEAMSPEHQKITQDWHAEQLAAKPKAPAAPAPVAPVKIAKSVDSLYDLFTALRKHL